MKHQISVHSDIPHISTPALTAHIKRCIRGALEQEGVTVPCEINVLLTDDGGIQAINRATREMWIGPTDVLSFPMFELTPGASASRIGADLPGSQSSGLLPSGGHGACPWSGPKSQAGGIRPFSPGAGGGLSHRCTPCCICWATTTWTRAR